MSGVFRVVEPSGSRWELALDLLRRGEAFSLGRMTFWPLADDAIEVHVASAWQHQNVTEATARRELETAREQLDALLADDAAFREAIGSSRFDYVLVEDYEKGVAICRLSDHDIAWLIDRA
jgi:hypothetical protein